MLWLRVISRVKIPAAGKSCPPRTRLRLRRRIRRRVHAVRALGGQEVRLARTVGRGVRVDDLPVRADVLKDECQAACGARGLAVGGLRLIPEAGDERGCGAEQADVYVAHVELRVLDLRVEALAGASRSRWRFARAPTPGARGRAP